MSKTYSEIRAELADKMGKTSQPAMDHRCRANGCPNAGTMRGGTCYYHHQEEDPSKRDAITLKIRSDFNKYRNWGAAPMREKA